MRIDLTKVEFDQNDLNTLHDVIFNALDKEDLTNEQIMEYWNKFPDNIKLDALKWGVSDTPTRDNMYVWLQENCIPEQKCTVKVVTTNETGIHIIDGDEKHLCDRCRENHY